MFKTLKNAVKQTFDVDGLIKVAFQDMKPFPSRNEINTKQSYYNKILNDLWKKKQANCHLFNQYEKQVSLNSYGWFSFFDNLRFDRLFKSRIL